MHVHIQLFHVSGMQFEYDAFVMYSSEDKGWVVRTLIPTLEEKCVYICRKTIAVVSIHFLIELLWHRTRLRYSSTYGKER